jgi:hypothetical protein
MVTITYERVEHSVTKKVPCRFCGKKINRSITLGQTISPFNTNDDGTRKTRQQIRAELRVRAESWQPVNDIHGKCIQAERDAQAAEAVTV